MGVVPIFTGDGPAGWVGPAPLRIENSLSKFDLLATSAFGIEAITARELQQLGYETQVIAPGRILFQGEYEDIVRANLWLRTADRVLIQVGRFPAADFDALFETTKSLSWDQWIDPTGAFPVNGKSLKSQLTSVPAVQRAVKKAIAESLLAAHGVEELPETGGRYTVEVALLNDEATLTIDTSGPSLHKRGYRKIVGTAPLKETLAAAMVQLSYWNRERPLIDPFCGTGTILIEAVMIGRNIAPGLRREFAAQQWDQIPPPVWEAARKQAESQQLEKLPETIIGYDTDFRVLKLARHAAEDAGIADEIHFQEKDFRELTSSRHYGCVITNPPYGERIGEQAELRELYRCFPEVLRRLPTWSHYILTAFSDFEQLVGQPANRRRKLYNGRIECQYFQFHGPRPPKRKNQSDGETAKDLETSTDATFESPFPSGALAESASPEFELTTELTTPPVSATPSWEVAKPENAEATAKNVPADDETAEPPLREAVPQPEAGTQEQAEQQDPALDEQIIPSLPRPKRDLTPAFGGLDSKALEQGELLSRRLAKLSRHLRRWPKKGIHCYRLYDRDIPEIPLVIDRYHDYLHIADYERPHTRTPAQYADWLEHMCESARRTLEIPKGNVFVKHRTRQRGSTQHEKVGDHRKTITAEEGGLHFEVNLSDYVDTGLFLDHRLTRQRVREEADGKRVLNLFCYTGAFSVYAAAGGAESTVSVDLSPTYLDWAERNFQLNDLRHPRHQFVRSDALEFLRNQRRGDLFDLVVVDVPTFSNSKRTEDVWDVQRDHVELLTAIEATLSSEGVVYFSTNFRRFKFDVENLPGFAIREISQKTVPEDFRNKRIHRCWRMTRSVAAQPE